MGLKREASSHRKPANCSNQPKHRWSLDVSLEAHGAGPKAKAATQASMSIAAQAARSTLKWLCNALERLCARNLGGFVPNKIFVGGVPITVTEDRAYGQ